MSKKILIITRAFYPQNSPRSHRATQLAIELAKQGNAVKVLTSRKDSVHDLFEKKNKVTILNIGSINYPEVRLEASNRFSGILRRLVRRALNLFFCYPDIEWLFKTKKMLAQEKGYDTLITIAVPHPIHWGAAMAQTKNGRTAKVWIADCGDPFMGSKTDSFKKMFYFKYIEKYWCKKVDFITVPVEGAIEAYYPEFKKKIKVIPQGFNFQEVVIDGSKYKPNLVPTFAYSGLLIPGVRDPEPLIDYLLELDVDFKFIFYTRSKQALKKYDHLPDSIEIRDFIPRETLLEQLSLMDFLVNFDNGVSSQTPSKLIDYYLTKRPTLSINSYDFDKQVVKEFLSRNYRGKYEFENPSQYQIQNVAKQFLNLT